MLAGVRAELRLRCELGSAPAPARCCKPRHRHQSPPQTPHRCLPGARPTSRRSGWAGPRRSRPGAACSGPRGHSPPVPLALQVRREGAPRQRSLRLVRALQPPRWCSSSCAQRRRSGRRGPTSAAPASRTQKSSTPDEALLLKLLQNWQAVTPASWCIKKRRAPRHKYPPPRKFSVSAVSTSTGGRHTLHACSDREYSPHRRQAGQSLATRSIGPSSSRPCISGPLGPVQSPRASLPSCHHRRE